MNLNLIELLTILQLNTIRNSSDDNNIKPQAMKRLVKFLKFGYFTRLLKVKPIVLSSALECTKTNTLRPLAQKGCLHPGTSFDFGEVIKSLYIKKKKKVINKYLSVVNET